MSEYRRDYHCIYRCDYHLVITTKYRRKVINAGFFEYLKRKLLDINEYYPKIFFKTINHDKDHMHMLISIPPQMSVGNVVRLIKTNTARGIKEQFPFLRNVYWGTDSLWSEGYFVSTSGINQDIIQKYIEKQGSEDAGQTTKLFE